MTPINPPRDDGAKNIVIGIAKRIRDYHFYFISSFSKAFNETLNVSFIRSPFQRPGRHSMSLFQKAFIFITSMNMMKKINVFQFFFTPQQYFSNVYSRFCKKYNKRSIQIVSSVHTLYNRNSKDIIPSLFFADYVVVHSEFARKRLIDAGVKNVTRIYPAIELERFNIKQIQDRTIEKSYTLRNGFNIIYPGTYKILNSSYGFDYFLKIVTAVIKKHRNIRFIMACRTRTREDLVLEEKFKTATGKLNIKKFFCFLNNIEDIPSLFFQCDAGIMPIKNNMVGILEIPLVLIELAALEKPVIYGNIAPLNELQEKGLGIMIDEQFPEAYAKNLLNILEDGKLASQIGKASKDAVINYFNMDNAAAEYKNLYDTLKVNVDG